MTPAELWLMEDAERHYGTLMSHEWYVRDLVNEREGPGNTAGRVSMALNLDHPPTTWEDLGIDPSDPMVAKHWTQKVTKGMQGLDIDRALAEEARRKGIQFAKIR